MNKITTATPEQWAAIDELREQWIANQTIQYADEDIINIVHCMYAAMGEQKPIVLIAPSPLAMVIWATVAIGALKTLAVTKLSIDLSSQLDDQFYSHLHSQLARRLNNHLAVQLESQINSQLHSQLGSQLHNQLSRQLGSQLDSQLNSQLDSQLASQLDSQLNSQLDSQLASQLHNQLDSQLASQLSRQLRSQLHNQLSRQLGSQLHSQLGSQLHNQLSRQLGSQLHNQLGSQLHNQHCYIGYWWRALSGYYRGSQVLGVEFDDTKLNMFVDWNEMASCWCAYNGMCVVSRNPTEVHWLGQDLHNEIGAAVLYADGWSHYAIKGVAVDEQIVMRPESQTISQIAEEKNEEVKRIRIERYGWDRYIKDVKAKVVDQRRNDVDGTYEALFVMAGGMKAFCGRCRSTGRVYFLEVDPSIKTCEQSQSWMIGNRPGNIIGAS